MSVKRLYRRSSRNIVATTHSFASPSRGRRRSREDLWRTGTQPSHRTACSYSKTLYGMRVNRWRANHRLSMVAALKNLVNSMQVEGDRYFHETRHEREREREREKEICVTSYACVVASDRIDNDAIDDIWLMRSISNRYDTSICLNEILANVRSNEFLPFTNSRLKSRCMNEKSLISRLQLFVSHIRINCEFYCILLTFIYAREDITVIFSQLIKFLLLTLKLSKCQTIVFQYISVKYEVGISTERRRGYGYIYKVLNEYQNARYFHEFCQIDSI